MCVVCVTELWTNSETVVPSLRSFALAAVRRQQRLGLREYDVFQAGGDVVDLIGGLLSFYLSFIPLLCSLPLL